METSIIQSIKQIEWETPVDKIIHQIRHLINSGQLKPGDRLPAERVLAERFGVGRGYVRDAIRKLEFYGLLKTSPQSGTYVSGYSIKILDGILTDIINFNQDDFASLVEARYYLEINAARLAASRRTEEDLKKIKSAVEDYNQKRRHHQEGVEEDMFFHLKIAHATKNPVFESMLLLLLPDLIRNIIEKKVCGSDRGIAAMQEHLEIYQAIADGDPDAAALAMAAHLDDLLKASRAGI